MSLLRNPALLCAALILSACVTTAPPAEPPPPPLTLDGQGLQPFGTPLRIDFGRGQAGVIDTVSRVLDERPTTVTVNETCPAGPVVTAAWRDGLALNFQNDAFVGWTNTDPALPAAGGLRAGQSRLSMPPVGFSVTTLGTEFARSDVSGVLTPDDAAIRVMWAGTSCVFR